MTGFGGVVSGARRDLRPQRRVRRHAGGADHRHRHRAWRAAAAVRPGRGAAGMTNIVDGVVEPPAPGDVSPLPEPGTPEHERDEALGAAALRAARSRSSSSPAAWRRAWAASSRRWSRRSTASRSSTSALRELDAVERRYGRRPPLLMMTSAATDVPIREALGDRPGGEGIGLFQQGVALRRHLTETSSTTTRATRRSTRGARRPGRRGARLGAAGAIRRRWRHDADAGEPRQPRRHARRRRGRLAPRRTRRRCRARWWRRQATAAAGRCAGTAGP